MEIKVKRIAKKATYTIGRLFVDGVRFCDTLEDTDRGLKQTDTLASIRERKIYGKTAIPAGRYAVDMDRVSPKYSQVRWIAAYNGGKMPHLVDVPGFSGIVIHTGNTAEDSCGCLLVGRNTVVGKVTSSVDVFKKLYDRMYDAHLRGQQIYITIE